MQSFSGNLHPRKGEKMLVKRQSFDGVSVEIEVDSDGEFWAEFDEEQHRAKTLEALEALLKKAADKRRARKAVDVSVINRIARPDQKNQFYVDSPYVEGRGVVHAKLRKRSDRISQFLLTADDGTKFQLSTYERDSQNICRRLTAEEVARYLRLAQDVDDAEAALESFRISISVDANELMGPRR